MAGFLGNKPLGEGADIASQEEGADAPESSVTTLITHLSPPLLQLDAASGWQDSRRLFHGRGQCYPGLAFVCVDLFDPVVVVTLFYEPPKGWEARFVRQLTSLLSATRLQGLILQRRYLQGAPVEVTWGCLPETVFARRRGQRFQLKLGQRQNSGYFLDMEPGRAWLEGRAAGKRVLNLFAYTCAFSVVALGAGAEQVVNVDMSRAALQQGRDNHNLNQLDPRQSLFVAENIMKSWGRIRRRAPFDLLVVDPPSYQPGSFVAKKDYARVIRRIPELVVPGGEILACLNAPELGEAFLTELFAAESPQCRFVERLVPSPDFPDSNPDRQLKLLVFCYEPEPAATVS